MESSKKNPEDAYGAAEKVAVELGLPPKFMLDLLREDDWSFVIKVHALLEGAIRHTLNSSFRDYGIEKFIASLQHSRKIDLAQESGAIQEEFVAGLRYISRLRNQIVHDIKRVSFSFEEYLSSPSNLNEFRNSILLGNVDEPVEVAGRQTVLRHLLLENPKFATFRFLIWCLSSVYLTAQVSAIQSRVNKIWRDALLGSDVTALPGMEKNE